MRRSGNHRFIDPTFWNFPDPSRESNMSAGGLAASTPTMTLPMTPTDLDLLRQMMTGDEDAFTQLYRRRQASVYRFALQMSGSRTLAEDVTQEVFIALIRDSARYDPGKGSLSAYLYGIARNHVLRKLEQDRPYVQFAERSSDVEENTPEAMIAEGNPLGELTRNERIQELRDLVLSMPPRYREIIVLCDLHEMSYVEAAEVIGCAVGTVRSRLHRARALLIEKLRAARDRRATSEEVKPMRCFA
jgi:RNA polymerase sigma-70 factor (ECF subfamily)